MVRELALKKRINFEKALVPCSVYSYGESLSSLCEDIGYKCAPASNLLRLVMLCGQYVRCWSLVSSDSNETRRFEKASGFIVVVKSIADLSSSGSTKRHSTE